MGTTSPGHTPCVLIYDGQCRLCMATKRMLEALPMPSGCSVRYVPYHLAEAADLLGDRHHPGCPEVAFLVEPSGRVVGGIEAFLGLLGRWPGGSPLARFLRMPPLYGIARWAYGLMARHRYRWFGART